MFAALASRQIVRHVRQARRHVCYLAPGIQDEVADALVNARRRSSYLSVTVYVDCDERALRMGYGTLSALETLRAGGIKVFHYAGLRTSLLLIDDEGWAFMQTPLSLESEPHSDETPNSLRLNDAQARNYLLRLCPAAREEALRAATPAEAERIRAIPLEAGQQLVEAEQIEKIKQAFEDAPPTSFDVARQVRVFQPFLQYVQLSLTGAAIQRKKVRIPDSIQHLGSSPEMEGRLQTTFNVLAKDSAYSSHLLERKLNDIRESLTVSLREPHGRLMLKRKRFRLDELLDELRAELEVHRKRVAASLQERIDEAKAQVVEYYLPLARTNPPVALRAMTLLPVPTDDEIRAWLDRELDRAFPRASVLVSGMQLQVVYKDVTYETLNDPEFAKRVEKAFPDVDWEKPFAEFDALRATRDDPAGDEDE